MNINKLLSFDSLYQEIKNYTMPIKTAYKMSLLVSAIADKKEFYQNTVYNIIETYAQKDESGNPVFTPDGFSVSIVPERRTECEARLKELNDLDVSVPDIKFTLDELETINLTVDQVMALMPFINAE